MYLNSMIPQENPLDEDKAPRHVPSDCRDVYGHSWQSEFTEDSSRDEDGGNVYRDYDWRPPGRDGESKRPAARLPCEPSETLSRRPPLDKSRSRAAGLPCRIPRIKNFGDSLSPRRSLQRSPCSQRSNSRGSPCNPSLSPRGAACDTLDRVSSALSSPYGIPRSSSRRYQYDYRAVNPGHTYHCESRSPRSKRLLCCRQRRTGPKMEPAGISTRNSEYSYPPQLYSTVKLDCHVKHQGLYTLLGRAVKDSFEPRPGDVLITRIPRKHSCKDCGYVEFVTMKHELHHFCTGDLLLRVGKFVTPNTWRYNKRHKLYHLEDDFRWVFVGMVDNFVNLLPVINHGSTANHVDEHCKIFYPRRGDLILHVHAQDNESQLEWFNPKTVISKGDALVRMYLGESPLQHEVVEGAAEMYRYNGKGFGWLFMGRDDCWYKDGDDVFGLGCNDNKDQNNIGAIAS